MAQLNIRMDDDMKRDADKLFKKLGMNLSTAVTVFISQSLREGGIPFEVKVDPFYSESNKKHLRKAIKQLDEGKGIEKSWDDLLAAEKEE